MYSLSAMLFQEHSVGAWLEGEHLAEQGALVGPELARKEVLQLILDLAWVGRGTALRDPRVLKHLHACTRGVGLVNLYTYIHNT
jgi:hypothetical protein